MENTSGLTDRPDCDGWWDWMEGGDGKPERLLLVADGSCVAYDDEWEAATGRDPEHGTYSENYWEGTDTTQEMMPGTWRYVGVAPTHWRPIQKEAGNG